LKLSNIVTELDVPIALAVSHEISTQTAVVHVIFQIQIGVPENLALHNYLKFF
jgi:hypothetical protein